MMDREFKIGVNTDSEIDLKHVDQLFHDINVSHYGVSRYVTRSVEGLQVNTTSFVIVIAGPVLTNEPAVICDIAGKIAKHHGAETALVTCAPLTAGVVDNQGRLCVSPEEIAALQAQEAIVKAAEGAPKDVDGTPIPPSKIN